MLQSRKPSFRRQGAGLAPEVRVEQAREQRSLSVRVGGEDAIPFPG